MCGHSARSQNKLSENECSFLGNFCSGHLADLNFTEMLEDSDHHMRRAAPFQCWLYNKPQEGHLG